MRSGGREVLRSLGEAGRGCPAKQQYVAERPQYYKQPSADALEA